MAEVFVAHQIGVEGFRRPVALKRISAQWSEDEQFASLFVTEARMAALLNHPNIVTVYDFDRGDAADAPPFTKCIILVFVDNEKITAGSPALAIGCAVPIISKPSCTPAEIFKEAGFSIDPDTRESIALRATEDPPYTLVWLAKDKAGESRFLRLDNCQ